MERGHQLPVTSWRWPLAVGVWQAIVVAACYVWSSTRTVDHLERPEEWSLSVIGAAAFLASGFTGSLVVAGIRGGLVRNLVRLLAGVLPLGLVLSFTTVGDVVPWVVVAVLVVGLGGHAVRRESFGASNDLGTGSIPARKPELTRDAEEQTALARSPRAGDAETKHSPLESNGEDESSHEERTSVAGSHRAVSHSGVDRRTGHSCIQFQEGQRTSTLHLSFLPAFSSVPAVELSLPGGVRGKPAVVRTYGTRIELRRSVADESSECYVEWAATGESPRRAA